MSRPGADIATSGRLLDPDGAEAVSKADLGRCTRGCVSASSASTRRRLSAKGSSLLHLENLPLMQGMIEIALRVTGTYGRGRANAGKVRLRRNTVHLPNLPSAFDGFKILHLSDLHADMSGPAMQRVAELAPDLDYDVCVLTGDYRGRTHGDCEPCLKVVAHLRKAIRGDIYGVLGNHDSIAMVPDLEALGIRGRRSTSASPYAPARLRSISPGWTTRISTAQTTLKKRRRIFQMVAFLSCSRTLRKSTGRPPTPDLA